MPTTTEEDTEKAIGSSVLDNTPPTHSVVSQEPDSNAKDSPPIEDGLVLTPKGQWLLLSFSTKPKHREDPLCRSLASKFWTTLVAALLVMIVRLLSLSSEE